MLNALRDAIAQGLLWAVMTLGVYITYKILDVADLSVDGTFALGGAVSAVMIVNGANPLLALLVSMVTGMVAGAVTGLLHTMLEVPILLAGILTQLGLYSINMRIMGRANTPLLGETTLFTILKNATGLSSVWVNTIIGLIFCIALIAIMYAFFGTELGCALRATGDNGNMARALGVSTKGMIVLGLLLSNGLVALSGGLVAQNQGYADVGMGTGTIVIGLASIIIGSSLFRFIGGSFGAKLTGAVLGSIVYRIIIALVLQLGMDTNDLKLLTAVMVGVALSVPMVRRKLREKNAARRDEHAAS